MPIQGLKFNIPTGQERHLSFQATGSFTSYNPNDGYALIALDRTATLLDYDHKLPSQSGGHFPGPINSYLSMLYVDQSGSGVSGQVIVYASADILQIPRFWSIGRAVQSTVTTLDIVQGTQPPNPSTGVARLWVDGNGTLHILFSDGTNNTVIDNTTPLGGDLYGTVPNGHVWVRSASNLNLDSATLIRWNNDSNHSINADTTNNLFHFDEYGTWQWRSSQHALATVMSLNDTGVLTISSDLHVGGAAYFPNNIMLNWNDTGGTVRGVLGLLSDNNVWFLNAGGNLIRFINQAGTVEIAHLDNTGIFVTANYIAAAINQGVPVAQSGYVRMPRHQQGYAMRNNANNGDDAIGFDGSDSFSIQGRSTVGVAGSIVADWIVNINGTQYRVALKQ